VALSLLTPVTVDNWASWLVTWALSSGLSGSWFFICVTSSVMNLSWSASTLPAAGLLLFRVLTELSKSCETNGVWF
jgi:hypothetical protein